MSIEDQGQVVLKFQYLKNVAIQFGEAGHFPIPMRMVEMPPDFSHGKQARIDGQLRGAIVPIFNMAYIHEIPLVDESIPDEVVVDSGDPVSDRLKKELQDDAFLAARKAREYNDEIRRIVYHHVKMGNIVIVDDPFENRFVKTKQGPRKPSDFIKEGEKAKIPAGKDTVTINPDLKGAKDAK